jgi:hypothetical protein
VSFKEIHGTGEFWAALFGAGAAFLLEGYRRWREDCRKQLEAGNATILALSQMYSLLKNIEAQLFAARAEFIRKRFQRAPLFFEYLSPVPVRYEGLKVPLEQLRFVLGTHDPDLLNRLLSVERGFTTILAVLEEHHRLHKLFQEKTAEAQSAGTLPAVFSQENLVATVGTGLYEQLRSIVESLQADLRIYSDLLFEMAKQLHALLAYQFPTRVVMRFDKQERRDAGLKPTSSRRPAMWRRAVRFVVDRVKGVRRF